VETHLVFDSLQSKQYLHAGDDFLPYASPIFSHTFPLQLSTSAFFFVSPPGGDLNIHSDFPTPFDSLDILEPCWHITKLSQWGL